MNLAPISKLVYILRKDDYLPSGSNSAVSCQVPKVSCMGNSGLALLPPRTTSSANCHGLGVTYVRLGIALWDDVVRCGAYRIILHTEGTKNQIESCRE